MKKFLAFTLAEAILTMTILGVIAAVMITTLKPSQYKQQGFDVLKKKIYADLDRTLETITVECTDQMNVQSKIFKNCDRTQATHYFGADVDSMGIGKHEAMLFANYLRGTVGSGPNTANGSCPAEEYSTSLRLKNGVCIYLAEFGIKVDVNGNQKPDEMGQDRMTLLIESNDGFVQSLDEALDQAEYSWEEF